MGEAVGGDVVIPRSLVVAFAFAVLLACTGCHRHAGNASADGGDPAPVALKEDTTGLLLTWIDDKGDFHVEQRVADVPIVGRDAVRVVDPTKDDGTHPDRIFVADLRTANADGSYAVRVSTRAEFEGLAEARREKNGPTLAAAGVGAADAGSGGLPSAPQMQLAPQPGQPDTPPDPTGAPRPVVIIYGASWCGPCHQAAAYLRQKGVPFVEKDIEEDANAAREMRAKLARVGMHSGSIPVLDVRGKVMVGFNPREVDEALGEAL